MKGSKVIGKKATPARKKSSAALAVVGSNRNGLLAHQRLSSNAGQFQFNYREVPGYEDHELAEIKRVVGESVWGEHLYVFRDAEGDAYIGRSGHSEVRYTEHARENKHRLYVSCHWPSCGYLEAETHKLLKAYGHHLHNSWYRVTPERLNAIVMEAYLRKINQAT